MKKSICYLSIGLGLLALVIVYLLIIHTSEKDNISGKWVWEESSEISTFTIDLIKEDNYVIGTYFAVAESGMKIDGDTEDMPSFKIEDLNKQEVVVTFKTYFSDSTGKVKLRFENDKLHWQITEKPEGEYYCPDVAVLKRFSK